MDGSRNVYWGGAVITFYVTRTEVLASLGTQIGGGAIIRTLTIHE